MRKAVYKNFFTWDFEKEEKWLNEMAVKGLCLISVGFGKYEFVDCEPGEYRICLQLLDKSPRHAESQKYIEFLEETGAEHIGSSSRWVYFRKKATDGNFELFSDNTSRIKHLNRIIGFIPPISLLNIILGTLNIVIAHILLPGSIVNFTVGIINVIIGVIGIIGLIRLIKKRNRIKKDGQLFE